MVNIQLEEVIREIKKSSESIEDDKKKIKLLRIVYSSSKSQERSLDFLVRESNLFKLVVFALLSDLVNAGYLIRKKYPDGTIFYKVKNK